MGHSARWASSKTREGSVGKRRPRNPGDGFGDNETVGENDEEGERKRDSVRAKNSNLNLERGVIKQRVRFRPKF